MWDPSFCVRQWSRPTTVYNGTYAPLVIQFYREHILQLNTIVEDGIRQLDCSLHNNVMITKIGINPQS
jgi:hypothetical protein